MLAGGAVSGGAFKVGGLKALDDFLVGRKVTDLDLYVGLSAGSILAVSLAGGITPDEMLKVIEGTSGRFSQLAPGHFYNPNVREFLERPAQASSSTSSPTSPASLETSCRACRSCPGPAARPRAPSCASRPTRAPRK